MNKQMIIAGLKARPVRTTVSILAVTLEVMLILVVVGLTTGIADETGKRIAGVGGDIMLQAPNSSVILGMSTAVMPETLAGKIAEVEGIKAEVTDIDVYGLTVGNRSLGGEAVLSVPRPRRSAAIELLLPSNLA